MMSENVVGRSHRLKVLNGRKKKTEDALNENNIER